MTDYSAAYVFELHSIIAAEKARADQAEAELAMIRVGIEAETISNTLSIYRGTEVMNMNEKLQAENAAIKGVVQSVSDVIEWNLKTYHGAAAAIPLAAISSTLRQALAALDTDPSKKKTITSFLGTEVESDGEDSGVRVMVSHEQFKTITKRFSEESDL